MNPRLRLWPGATLVALIVLPTLNGWVYVGIVVAFLAATYYDQEALRSYKEALRSSRLGRVVTHKWAGYSGAAIVVGLFVALLVTGEVWLFAALSVIALLAVVFEARPEAPKEETDERNRP